MYTPSVLDLTLRCIIYNEVFDVLVNRVPDIRDVKTRVPGIRYEA